MGLVSGWLRMSRFRSLAQGTGEGWALLPTHCWPSLTVLLQVSGHLDYAKQMDVILKAVGIHTKPGWDEKGLLLAPSSLPQDEPSQVAVETTHQDGQTQGLTPEDTPKVAMSTDSSQAQVPTVLDQPEGTPLPPAASPAESPCVCRHGMGPNPLGCPDCTHETQGFCQGLD
jgi:hypothetical protein